MNWHRPLCQPTVSRPSAHARCTAMLKARSTAKVVRDRSTGRVDPGQGVVRELALPIMSACKVTRRLRARMTAYSSWMLYTANAESTTAHCRPRSTARIPARGPPRPRHLRSPRVPRCGPRSRALGRYHSTSRARSRSRLEHEVVRRLRPRDVNVSHETRGEPQVIWLYRRRNAVKSISVSPLRARATKVSYRVASVGAGGGEYGVRRNRRGSRRAGRGC